MANPWNAAPGELASDWADARHTRQPAACDNCHGPADAREDCYTTRYQPVYLLHTVVPTRSAFLLCPDCARLYAMDIDAA